MLGPSLDGCGAVVLGSPGSEHFVDAALTPLAGLVLVVGAALAWATLPCRRERGRRQLLQVSRTGVLGSRALLPHRPGEGAAGLPELPFRL